MRFARLWCERGYYTAALAVHRGRLLSHSSITVVVEVSLSDLLSNNPSRNHFLMQISNRPAVAGGAALRQPGDGYRRGPLCDVMDGFVLCGA